MDKEAFSRLFLFDKAFIEEKALDRTCVSTEEWETEWDTEIKDQLVKLKQEIETMEEVKRRVLRG